MTDPERRDQAGDEPRDDAAGTIIEIPEAGTTAPPLPQRISEGEFVRHQISSPLAVLKGWLELATRTDIEVPPELIARAFTAMSSATDRLTKQIAALLDPATGLLEEDLSFVRQPCVVDDIVSEAMLLSPHAERVVVVGSAGSERVLADPERTTWMLTELIENAATHGAAGGPIELNVTASAGSVAFAVTSTGTLHTADGRDPRAPFVHGQSKGLGLGLHRTTVIAEALGGGFTIADVDRSTVQTLSLPEAT